MYSQNNIYFWLVSFSQWVTTVAGPALFIWQMFLQDALHDTVSKEFVFPPALKPDKIR